MKKSNHQILVDCAKELIQQYTAEVDKVSIIGDSCPLCEKYSCGNCPLSIVKDTRGKGCFRSITFNYVGCFRSITFNYVGCFRFITFNYVTNNEPSTWAPRREFWVKVLDHIRHDNPKKYQLSKLTRKTFLFMLDIENEIVNKYNLQ